MTDDRDHDRDHGIPALACPAAYERPGGRSTSHPCELAPGHTGWHEADDGMRWSSEPDTELLTVDGLTAEQEIRARALDSATGVYLGAAAAARTDAVLFMADRFAAYITVGAQEPDDPPIQYGPHIPCICRDIRPPNTTTEHIHVPGGCVACDCRHYPGPRPSTTELS